MYDQTEVGTTTSAWEAKQEVVEMKLQQRRSIYLFKRTKDNVELQCYRHDRTERGFPPLYSTSSTGGLDIVALHVGDISRLRVDATVFGTLPSLKIYGGGRGFVGCSTLIAGAGPMLPLFVSQQRKTVVESPDNRDCGAPANAAAAVAALREGIARLLHVSSAEHLETSDSIPREEISKLLPNELSAMASRAARRLLARHGEDMTCVGAADAGGNRTIASTVPPAALLPPGAVILSPGFSLPSAFLVHVVEPNAIYWSEHFLRALVRSEELEAANRHNGHARGLPGFNKEAQKAVDEKAESRLLRCCWERMRLLEECYVKALDAAAELGVQSVALPCLGTGAGRYPAYVAARCAAKAVGRWMKGHYLAERKAGERQAPKERRTQPMIERVVFCTTSDQEWKALRHLIPAFVN